MFNLKWQVGKITWLVNAKNAACKNVGYKKVIKRKNTFFIKIKELKFDCESLYANLLFLLVERITYRKLTFSNFIFLILKQNVKIIDFYFDYFKIKTHFKHTKIF